MEEEYEKLKEKVLKHNPHADTLLLDKAYALAQSAHKGQKRKSGEPFVVHPVAVATMLADMDMDLATVIAGLLHDTVEDTVVTLVTIAEQFGSDIAYLVDGVTKLKHIPMTTKEELQAENLRKMFLSMASDIRVIVIKLVDRLHNMRTLQYVNTDSQITKARETLEIYTPLAHRLGMTKIKWELEDLCFKYLEPEAYNSLERQINQKREEQEKYISDVLAELKEKLEEAGITAKLDGRPKHLYSIHRKMIKQNKTLEQIYDLLAIRVIVNTVQECYTVLGIIHELYKPIPGRFKDYIAMPKPNMYQSLHTTLIGPKGRPFEAQIRTWEMHRVAENGIAAHWKYKEDMDYKATDIDLKLEWVRNLLDNQKDIDDASEFAETFKMDLFTDEVFVFTPKGEVKVFPTGSTPIDFAYSIHSAIGNRMTGAKVNGEIKPLNYKLKTGDFVEIITSAAPGRGPSRDWLNIVKSSEAKSKIKQWFKKERSDENIERGKDAVEREIRRLGCSYTQLMRDEWIQPHLQRHHFSSMDDMYNVIGFGDVSAQKFVGSLYSEYQKEQNEKEDEAALQKKAEAAKRDSEQERQAENYAANNGGVIVKGLDNCLVRLSRCCNPVPGDSIVGYVTRGRGVSVHRTDCPNIVSLSEGDNRMIDVRWADKSRSSYVVQIGVKAVDSQSLFMDIVKTVADCNLSMQAINARKTRDNYELVDLTVEITSREELEKLVKRIRRIENVVDVSRKSN
ncbi:MAG: bifunctional (p)ppGpp synthetase/guanosine-3',5'-bis(diphosphate) 3'-pyrophosphohydrolase [Clostridia bacterium]|nr:bifunctional (p)ppGpp synthetase/guanosine-3',5'-bis(diphosphate) 3'-pyrophosphohydrolase [Clostridia bacterium]